MEMIREYADWFYLIGAVLFILTLRGLSGPKTAIQGNRYGMIAMAIAVLTTFFVADNPVVWMIVGAMVAGAVVGIARARTVPMTQMPETVALMHSLVGLAAVLIAIAAMIHNNKLIELGPDLLAANAANFPDSSSLCLWKTGCEEMGKNHFWRMGKSCSGHHLYCHVGVWFHVLLNREYDRILGNDSTCTGLWLGMDCTCRRW